MKDRLILIGLTLCCFIHHADAFQSRARADSGKPTDHTAEALAGTRPLTWGLTAAGLSTKMMDGAHAYIDAKIDETIANRSKSWHRNLSSPKAYDLSIEPNLKQFMKDIGVVDRNNVVNYDVGLPDEKMPVKMERVSTFNDPEIMAETPQYTVYQVRWPVLKGVYGEGLLLRPKTKVISNIIAIPDADQTPEQLVGLSPGIPAQSQFARRLAENGFQVLIPVLISRTILFPDKPKQLQQTYREWIYRQAYHMGRHIIGFEVEKIMAAIDWFKQSDDKDLKIGVAGYAEGGLIAFYAAAVDRRIDAVLVSGYFDSRRQVWEEPIYRNVWGLLSEFGDAEIASLIAPRPMVIEYSAVPHGVEEATKKPLHLDTLAASGYKGSLQTPPFERVQAEFDRIDQGVKPGFQPRVLISGQGNKPIDFGSEKALLRFTKFLGYHSPTISVSNEIPADRRHSFKPEERQKRQVKELEDFVQGLLHVSDYVRDSFFLHKVMPEFGKLMWNTRRYDLYYPPARFIEQAKQYRTYFSENILGKFDDPLLPPNARTEKIYDKELWTGYNVVLDVYKNLIAAGVLLLPKDLKPGEKRPVVVIQHGRNGLPKEVIEGNTSYYNMGAKLADQGFIVFIPYGLFRGEDRYRWLNRKANTIGKTLFSFIISQHEQILHWLGSLPYVDSKRIAFYGKSYGGETAMRVPSVLEGYCLSICSGDFGNWTRKVVDTHWDGGFMDSEEWEMPYFNMGSTFSYAEMAYLIFPRPFMVERGHHDIVQPDSWVASEYAKVKYLFVQFGLGDHTDIGYFNGGHASRGVETFAFLHKHLRWP